jgi:hypothetical protein
MTWLPDRGGPLLVPDAQPLMAVGEGESDAAAALGRACGTGASRLLAGFQVLPAGHRRACFLADAVIRGVPRVPSEVGQGSG